MKKILIVDDEPNIVMTLEYAFRKQNFEVFIARDGSEALEILKHQDVDLVLLDIMMPKVDGYETLIHIKSHFAESKTKVVFLSAKTREEDISKAYDLGVDLYLTKPFSTKKVIAEVSKLLEFEEDL